MTPSELAEIDRQVAEAIGLEIVQQFHYGRPYCAVVKPPHGMSRDSMCCDSQGNDLFAWSPSTDYNDAMLAAEKAGLFLEHGATIYQRDDKFWAVGFLASTKLVIDQSGPLCIARAILHLKGKA